ncbi:MAG: chorismate synthase [Candidatus Margulisbacteria bacterium]|nr:chorismate synthase [Candidatus Margulisiibacteriota bacterium]
MIRYLTAGESHGKALTVIIEGVPAGLEISINDLQAELKRRKTGYGRGGRQKIETDEIEILSGVRFGKSTGSPISIILFNKDFENWSELMAVKDKKPKGYKAITIPRPGHADYAGFIKYNLGDIRDVLERSSARETAMRVVAGAISKKILEVAKIQLTAYVYNIGGVEISRLVTDIKTIRKLSAKSECLTVDGKIEEKMKKRIDEAQRKGVSVGGKIMVVAENVPVGLGSYVQWDRKLDACLAKAIMSVQAIKGVEFGLGFESAELTGNSVHDEFCIVKGNVSRKTNNAGGIEGGMSNGQPIIIKAVMKPIPTMKTPLSSVDLKTKKTLPSFFERADVCAVPAAAVVCENVVALELASALLEKFGGDSISAFKRSLF